MTEDTAKATQLAHEHWVWLESLLSKMYQDAFIHGYKHGVEAQRKFTTQHKGSSAVE